MGCVSSRRASLVMSTWLLTLVFRLTVGDEPQSIALDPDGEYACVASAADNSVTVIRVTNTSPFAAVIEERFVTGAEPWNIVIFIVSPIRTLDRTRRSIKRRWSSAQD
jgi:DNA-binding beta-propeller fold protein YncE